MLEVGMDLLLQRRLYRLANKITRILCGDITVNLSGTSSDSLGCGGPLFRHKISCVRFVIETVQRVDGIMKGL